MKNILTILLFVAATATVNAQSKAHKISSAHKPGQKSHTKAYAGSNTDLSHYAGTNESNLALVREGIRKA